MHEQRDWSEELLRLGGQQGLKWAIGAGLGILLLLLILFVVFMSAIGVFLGGGAPGRTRRCPRSARRRRSRRSGSVSPPSQAPACRTSSSRRSWRPRDSAVV